MQGKHQISKDDVARLTRGKRSKNRVGSRQIRHRLRQDELERLAIARERGYLLLTRSTRTALQNAWHLDCLANKRPFACVERVKEGFVIITSSDPGSHRETVDSLERVSALVKAL